MKINCGLLAAISMICGACDPNSLTTHAEGNFTCDTTELVSGQTINDPRYSVAVGVWFEEPNTRHALLVSQHYAPSNDLDLHLKLESSDGSAAATVFSKDSTRFTVTSPETGKLSLDNGHQVFDCRQLPVGGGVTGSN